MHASREAEPYTPCVIHVTTVAMSLVFLRALTALLKQRGLRVCAVCAPGADVASISSELRIDVITVPMERRITPFRDLLAVLRLVRVFRKLRPEIVHGHTPKGSLVGLLAAWIARVPVRVYHLRGLPLQGADGAKRALLTWTERVCCWLAHRVIAVGPSVQSAAVDLGLCPADRIMVAGAGSGQGVDAAGRFSPEPESGPARTRTRARLGVPADTVVVGFVGRLVRDKGVVELADAWTLLKARFKALHMICVGPFEEQDPLPQVVREQLASDPRVHLTGPDWDTPSLYAAMDVVVLPTYREGFPNVLLEAAAMQLPVVATSIPACVDAVSDNITGTLVPPRNVPALAEAIGRYVESGSLRAAHGIAARERVLRDFQPARIADAVFREYLRLVDAHGSARARAWFRNHVGR